MSTKTRKTNPLPPIAPCSDAEAERRGAMAVLNELEAHAKEMVEASRHDKDAKWEEAAGYFAMWATLRLTNAREAIERGEVLPAKRKGQDLVGHLCSLPSVVKRGESPKVVPEPWIVQNPAFLGGRLHVRGTAITVEKLQEAARLYPAVEILNDNPGLTAEGLAAALAYEMPKTKARKR